MYYLFELRRFYVKAFKIKLSGTVLAHLINFSIKARKYNLLIYGVFFANNFANRDTQYNAANSD